MSTWARRLIPVIPVFGRQRQGDFQKSKASLGYRDSVQITSATWGGGGKCPHETTRPPEDYTQKVLTESDMRMVQSGELRTTDGGLPQSPSGTYGLTGGR